MIPASSVVCRYNTEPTMAQATATMTIRRARIALWKFRPAEPHSACRYPCFPVRDRSRAARTDVADSDHRAPARQTRSKGPVPVKRSLNDDLSRGLRVGAIVVEVLARLGERVRRRLTRRQR